MPSRDALSRLLLPAVLLPVLLLGIFDHDLWTPDEPRAAEISREFLEPGHSWAVPTLNGEPFLEKPPLVYWTAACSMKLFGVNAPAARLPCVLFGIGTLLFTGLLGRSLFDLETGRGAALILATSSGFILVSHHLESDAGLVCFTAGAAWALQRALAASPRWFLAFHGFLLGGFFSKGLIALVFMGVLFASWVIWTRSWKDLLRPWLWLGLPILAAPVALWLVQISRDPRGDLLRVFLLDNQFGRFLGRGDVRLGHYQPFYYYGIQFPAQSAPWIALFVAFLPRFRRRAQDFRLRFLFSWLVPGLVFLTLSTTKRGIYAIPLLPPLAILTAHGFVDQGKGAWIPRLAGSLAAAVSLAALLLIPTIDPRKSMRPFGEALAARCGSGTRVCALDPDETTLAVIPFYTGRRVEVVRDADLEALARSSVPVALVLGPHPTPEGQEKVQRFFPLLRWESPPNHSRRMEIHSRE
ncbi:MAG TPA: glycosyltransferase family 39 protein [Planctomycetota bacterium]|nr:glycosyltransferase family 39 protein [Planctomycetota bacterium]